MVTKTTKQYVTLPRYINIENHYNLII